MKNASRLAVCGITTALSVVLMFLGGISFVFAYVMPMLVGLFMIMIKRTFGSASAWITYAATAVLSFILVADKECMLMYVMFFGFYPIIYESINKVKNTILRIALKLIIFNGLISAVQLILVYVFGIPFLEEGEGVWLISAFVLLMNFLFLFYDRILVSLTKLYEMKVEPKIKKYFK